MFWYIVVAALLAATHAVALGGGAYLHYRFGAATVRAAKAVAGAFESK